MSSVSVSAAAEWTFIGAMRRHITVKAGIKHDCLTYKPYDYSDDPSKDVSASDHGYSNNYTCYCRQKQGSKAEPKYY